MSHPDLSWRAWLGGLRAQEAAFACGHGDSRQHAPVWWRVCPVRSLEGCVCEVCDVVLQSYGLCVPTGCIENGGCASNCVCVHACVCLCVRASGSVYAVWCIQQVVYVMPCVHQTVFIWGAG